MSAKSLMLAAAIAATALAGSAPQASAGHRHFNGHHRHFFFHVGPRHNVYDCSYEREMWHETGLIKWKRRYYVCKGWW